MGFGKLIVEKNNKYVLDLFYQYQLIINIFTLTLLSVAIVLIIPFVHIYMKGATDVNYINFKLMFLLSGIMFFELIHIPSGNIINMSGNFKIARDIQFVATCVILIGMILGRIYMEFYGIIIAVLLTSIILAILEVVYITTVYFRSSLFVFLKMLIPSLVISVLLVYYEFNIVVVKNYLDFFIVGMALTVINLIANIFINIMFNKTIITSVFKRINNLLHNNAL